MAMMLPCGCRYCFVCIPGNRGGVRVCLGCGRESVNSGLPDHHARRMMQEQVIRCINYKRGCTAQFMVTHLTQHLRKECNLNSSLYYQKDVSDISQDHDTPSDNGILEWNVENVSEARTIACVNKGTGYQDSPSFYSSKNGYLMGARLYLNGDGMGWNSHVSIFMYIKRGKNDDSLEWPFDLYTTFEILDQEARRENITDGFPASPTSNSFYKPKKDRTKNIPTGCPLFAPKEILDNPKYVKNNTLMIRVIVGPKQ
ncbi:TNF receptor-associated factor 3-like [Anneissia japonica]|uniref:TNF receptor-associated factor 3-like n=1 Tax=Anneissia japonica TaxID=1529436 RepID=UPI00142599DA|nr:TNF receptor-associated factor 3-like [Anneissia japonica]